MIAIKNAFFKRTFPKSTSSKKNPPKKTSSKKTSSKKNPPKKTSEEMLLENYVEELRSLKSGIFWDILFFAAFICSIYIDLLAVTVGIAMFYHAIAILNLVYNIIIYSNKIPLLQQSEFVNNTKLIKILGEISEKISEKTKVSKETEIFISIRNLHGKCLAIVCLVYFVMFLFGVFSGKTIFTFTSAWITLMITEFYVKYQKNTSLNNLIKGYSK